jgi:hypothetical protein
VQAPHRIRAVCIVPHPVVEVPATPSHALSLYSRQVVPTAGGVV